MIKVLNDPRKLFDVSPKIKILEISVNIKEYIENFKKIQAISISLYKFRNNSRNVLEIIEIVNSFQKKSRNFCKSQKIYI